MKHRVLLIEPTIQPVGVDLIKENCETFMAPDGKEETLIRCINENQIEGMVTRVETITRKIFESCPTLKIVAQHGVGVDNIDVAAATDHGVKVLNIPDGNYTSVAEHVMMFVLASSRTLLQADYAVRHGNWKFRETNIPHAVAEKTLLIVGLGRIGRTVAKMAAAFDMNVMAYDPFIPADKMAELGIKKAQTLDDGLKAADYVTIQLHLTPETRGMMSTEQFKIMKKSAVLLNLSRGPVVDQSALYEALKNHEIAGAALDVLASEPPAADEPLLTLDNVIFTPHFGGDTLSRAPKSAFCPRARYFCSSAPLFSNSILPYGEKKVKDFISRQQFN
jgi:D-3-phosphoglycerate dehydrogenase